MATETDPISVQSDLLESRADATPNQPEPLDTEQEEEDGADFELEERVETESVEYTPFSSNENPEKQAAYYEYKRLEKCMRQQNNLLENLKQSIQTMQQREHCLNKTEKSELKRLRDQWEQEVCKLKSLIRDAVNLQNHGSKRHYREFPLATTFDEDVLDTYDTTLNQTKNFRATAGESSDVNTCSANEESQISMSEEKKLMKNIFAAIKEINCLKENKQQKTNQSTACLEQDSFEKIKSKVKCMQQKISKLTEELHKKEGECEAPHFDPCECLCKNKKSNNVQQLKDNYLYLLTEFTKKDGELKDLTKK